MYVILRKKSEDAKAEICFVQATTAEKAKELVGVPEESTDWGVLNTELMSGFCEVREGYFVISF